MGTIASFLGVIALFWGIGRLGEMVTKSAKKSAKKAWKKKKSKKKANKKSNPKGSELLETVEAKAAARIGQFLSK